MQFQSVAGIKPEKIRRRVRRGLAVSMGIVSLFFGVLTFVAMSGQTPFDVSTDQVLVLIYIDVVLLLSTSVILTHRMVQIWSARRRGSVGAQLHSTLVLYFAALAAVPAILISIFSLLFFDLGLESWFSQRVRTAVVESQEIASSYLREHNKSLATDALQISVNLSRDAHILESNHKLLERALNVHTSLRGISEANIFHPVEGVIARSGFPYAIEFEPIPQVAFEKARSGEAALLDFDNDQIAVMVKLQNFIEDYYLLVARSVDQNVLEKAQRAESAVQQFQNLEAQRADVKISFVLAFMIVTLLLLIAAVWIGLSFAANLTRPISTLIAGTEAIRSGDLSVRVPESYSENELGTLSRAFNRMAQQLENQRKEITEASAVIDERRRFTEAVLTGVSAGVIGLDSKGRIDLPNKKAGELLDLNLEELKGYELSELVPEMTQLLDRAKNAATGEFVEAEIKVAGTEIHRERTLYVRIGVERHIGASKQKIDGYIVTFDDITNLQNAQRTAAWADVARRIAHEIKNPLTPIQLSAERLKRKYAKQITEDKETFENCTNTIIRHVEDIGQMVSEFSSFARMPKPSMQDVNLADLCRQAVFLQKNANRNIQYETKIPSEMVRFNCDGRQISQVLTNLLQNAFDSMEGKPVEDGIQGHILFELTQKGSNLEISITDDGCGLPVEGRAALMEPYVTTRKKGTGLGLAIVKKIIEDHDGDFTLDDRDDGFVGTVARLVFPLEDREQAHSERNTDQNKALS